MPRVVFRLYAELNDRLLPERRGRPFEVEVPSGQRLGEALGALGLATREIDLVLLNGARRPFTHPLIEGDRVAAYPVFEAFDVSPLLEGERPLRATRFFAGPGLSRLCLALREAGLDCDRWPGAAVPGQILLSREAPPQGATHALRILAPHWREQLCQLVARVHLEAKAGASRRCARCNATLEESARCGACGRKARSALRPRVLRNIYPS